MFNQTILYIDTTDNKKTIVGINCDGKEKIYQEKVINFQSQNLLPLIQKALDKEKIKFPDLTEIKVNQGPGSFTGIRVGVTVANTLGWVLNIPVNGKKRVFPKYHVCFYYLNLQSV